MNKNKMTIACVGCSHANSYCLNPWPKQIAKLLNSELILSSSPGAGVGICVDKLAYILSNHSVDHVFFQAPADLRFCIGMNSQISKDELDVSSGNAFHDPLLRGNNFYTFIMTLKHGNKDALNNMVDKDAQWDAFDEIWGKYFFDNFYETRINFIKNLLQVQNLCKNNNVSYTIFTWHDFPWDNDNLLFQAWVKQLDFKNIIRESAINFNKRHNRMNDNEFVYKPFSSDGYHLNDVGNFILAKDYILPFYNKQHGIGQENKSKPTIFSNWNKYMYEAEGFNILKEK
jgi:acyl-CoA-binding protein